MQADNGTSEIDVRDLRHENLNGRRVLFLPKNSRTAYFASFLSAARETHGWQVRVVCPDRDEEFWKRSIGDGVKHSAIPNFAQQLSWEKDPAVLAELDRYIARCEAVCGIPAGRIVLAGERDLGRGFSQPAYYWFLNGIAKTVLASPASAFPIVRRMFAFARETLREADPDLVMAGEWADPLCFVFHMAAREAGIACAVNRPSKIWSGRCYWSNEQLMYNHRTRAAVEERRRRGAKVSQRALDRIAAFRSNPETLGYVRANWEKVNQRSWLLHHLQLARLFGAQFAHRLRNRAEQEPKSALQLTLEHYRRPWLKWRQHRYFKRLSDKHLRDTNYILLAFHKDPEQALNYQAPFWFSQYNTAALLSGALPAGYKLLVREHRLNTGRRPTEFYRELMRLPGLVLIDAFDDQFKYISNADLIVTDNGSTGWEGLMLRRPVLTLADNFYQAAGLARRIRDPSRLNEEIIEVLDRPAAEDAKAYDRALGWLLDAEWETTAPLDEARHDRTLNLLADVLSPQDEPKRNAISINA